MMDVLIYFCRMQGISVIYGYYYPTAKNGMVKDFYALQGFAKVEEKPEGTVWKFLVPDEYDEKNKYIKIDK